MKGLPPGLNDLAGLLLDGGLQGSYRLLKPCHLAFEVLVYPAYVLARLDLALEVADSFLQGLQVGVVGGEFLLHLMTLLLDPLVLSQLRPQPQHSRLTLPECLAESQNLPLPKVDPIPELLVGYGQFGKLPLVVDLAVQGLLALNPKGLAFGLPVMELLQRLGMPHHLVIELEPDPHQLVFELLVLLANSGLLLVRLLGPELVL